MNVGFVGTGNMGRPMAANILKAGHQMTVYDLSAEATAPLERAGATRATAGREPPQHAISTFSGAREHHAHPRGPGAASTRSAPVEDHGEAIAGSTRGLREHPA